MILRNLFVMSLFLVIYMPETMAYGAKKSKTKVIPKIEETPYLLPFSFDPPKKWQCITDKDGLPAKVEAVYMGNGAHGFNPSINIAMEETNLPLADYVKMAQGYHEKQPHTKCLLLGSCNCRAGSMELLQIEQITSWGEVRFLQAAFVKDKMAYVVTATCLEKDYDEYYQKFLQSLQTFNLNTPSKKEGKENQ